MVWEYAIPIVASLIGGGLAKAGQDDANSTNIQLNQDQRDWMTQMSNTSYQRATADMEAAGLNPMLAYSQGGASTPTSAAPVVQNSLGAGVAGATASAQSAIGTMQGVAQIGQTGAQADLATAQAEKARSETVTNELNTARAAADLDKVRQDTATSAAGAKATSVHADNEQQQILGSIADSATKHAMFQAMNEGGGFAADVRSRKAAASLAEYDIPGARNQANFETSDFGAANPYLRNILGVLRGVSSAAHGLR